MNIIPMNPWKVVAVRFHSNLNNDSAKLYDYRSRLDFEPGDVAVVEVSGQLKVVDVMEVRESGSMLTRMKESDLKWIVDKVDTKPYLDMMREAKRIDDELIEVQALAEQQREVAKVREAFTNDANLLARYDDLIARKAQL